VQFSWAFHPGKAILETLIHGKSACYNWHDRDADDSSFLGKVLLVFHTKRKRNHRSVARQATNSMGTFPIRNNRSLLPRWLQNFSFPHGELVPILQHDITRSGNNQTPMPGWFSYAVYKKSNLAWSLRCRVPAYIINAPTYTRSTEVFKIVFTNTSWRVLTL